MTSEEFKKLFLSKGWKGGDISFHEVTIEEAKNEGLLDVYYGIIDKKKQFFRMNENGNIYDTKCNVIIYNLKAIKM